MTESRVNLRSDTACLLRVFERSARGGMRAGRGDSRNPPHAQGARVQAVDGEH